MRAVKPINLTEGDKLQFSSVPEPDNSAGEFEWEPRPADEPYDLEIDASAQVNNPYMVGGLYNKGLNRYMIGRSRNPDGTLQPRAYYFDATTLQPTGGYFWTSSPEAGSVFFDLTTRKNADGSCVDANEVYFAWVRPVGGRFYSQIWKWVNGVFSKAYNGISAEYTNTYRGYCCCAGASWTVRHFVINSTDTATAIYVYDDNDVYLASLNLQQVVNSKAIDYDGTYFNILSGDGNVHRYTYDGSSFTYAGIAKKVSSYNEQITSIFSDGANNFIGANYTAGGVKAGLFKALDSSWDQVVITPPPTPTWQTGDRVILTENHTLYEAAADNRDKPTDGVNKVPPTWVEVSATNKYRAFDESVSTVTQGQSPLIMEIRPDEPFDAIIGFNVQNANTVTVIVVDPDAGEVYRQVVEMVDNGSIVDWYSYLWDGFSNINEFSLFNLPIYPNADLRVEIEGAGLVGIGTLVTGKSIELGQANYGTSIQQLDFSTVDEDVFGNLNITKRPGAKLVNYDVSVQKSRLNYVYRELEKLSGVATVWSGTDNVQDETLVYGYHRDNNLNLDTPTLCKVTIQVRGLI